MDVGPVFEALADPTRRRVVELLGAGPLRAGELAEKAGTSAPVMSRHLKHLLVAGVIVDERVPEDARARVFRLRPEGVAAVASWADQLDAFKHHVEKRRKR